MNRIKKSITVRFFSIEAHDIFFKSFVSTFIANKGNSNGARIFNLKTKKHLIKLYQDCNISGVDAYAVTVIRERNTWQAKATSDGQISGISLNQGIIGDPYYFFVVPSKEIIFGFTSGPSTSLKSVAKSMLDQFQNNRTDSIKLDFISREKNITLFNTLSESGNLHFKISPSHFSEISSDAPRLIQDLSTTPYFESNSELALGLDFADTPDHSLDRDKVIEIIDYLSDHEGCKMLKVKWIDSDGKTTQFDFINAFLNFKTEIETRSKFIDENLALEVLSRAFSEYLESNIN